ncbi:MAG: hypothetical protein CVU39_11445 [Chloroflexi bacterium HGW-Chloroflexi-10]|nr:MAG: hypothetical protein CVU39_11445 [Chloroflexi bacterium HGW-Chloroflexi-10]
MQMPITNNRYLAIDRFHQLFQQGKFRSRIATLFGSNGHLLDFEEYQPYLQDTRHYDGVQQIPIEHIKGSVGRVADFDNTFRPLKKYLLERWVAIALIWEQSGWPAIQVYRLGEDYFVVDGHHRVSVARALGIRFIDAEVWEYDLRPNTRSWRVLPGEIRLSLTTACECGD